MVTKEQINRAQNVDLFTYLVTYHQDDIETSGEWLRFLPDPSVNIKAGHKRWKDYSGKHTIANHEWLSNIDFLMIFYGLSFIEAVEELNQHKIEAGASVSPIVIRKEFVLPPKDEGQYTQTAAYLSKTRGIPGEVVANLIKEHLLYQTTVFNPNSGKAFKNMVFVNKDEDYYETHGTMSFGKSFHGCGKLQIDNYWSMKRGDTPRRVYICEAAIDAISLFILHCYQGKAGESCYASIGGCDNYKTIERLCNEFPEAILAVDNDGVTGSKDNAGQKCRDHFPNIPAIIPINKDWNDDLRAFLA